MAKQIKKVLLRQISLFVGLAMIVSFSSIFGAILLRQVLAAPAGTGSVITVVNNLATALTDIKGTGFIKDTHSLKQIKGKSDDTYNLVNTKCGGGVTWAGYTTNTLGNMGGIIGVNQKCNTAYAGSHACTYDEILKLGPNYPNSQDAWIIDGSYMMTRADNAFTFMYLQCTRDGYCGDQLSGEALCRRWTDGTGTYRGVYLKRLSGYLQLVSCDFASPLPCCK